MDLGDSQKRHKWRMEQIDKLIKSYNLQESKEERLRRLFPWIMEPHPQMRTAQEMCGLD